ncbi:MAG: hypothetical protein HYX39_12805 [Bacteroidetes bacterium]|nr:hypothetical protein [Bacteroidota bacterium]
MLLSCASEKEEETYTYLNPVDSFEIEKFETPYEIGAVQNVDKNAIITFDGFNSIRNYTLSEGNTFNYKKTITLKNTPESISFIAKDFQTNFYFLVCKNSIIKYDSAFNYIKSYHFKYEAKFLKDKYRPVVSNTFPLIVTDSSLITAFNHNTVTEFFTTYKEPSKMKFVFKNDSIVRVNTFMRKPTHLVYYDGGMPTFYFSLNNKIIEMSGNLDTIYTYDLSTQKENKYPLHNSEYTLPERLDTKRIVNDQPYLTKHYLNNFNYCGMFYNPLTRHIVIFYSTPLDNNTEKNESYKFSKALILNEQFEILEYVKFNQKYVPDAGFYIKNKGLALPIHHLDLTNEKTVYHIYNF